ncbi:MAG: ABC transporter substrate-binding protein [Promethearchaeota archaeon]|jgi:ABC-type transport system substrate-binding protein
MKLKTRNSVILLATLLISVITPFAAAYIPRTSQAARISFIWGGGTTSTHTQWDPAIVNSNQMEAIEGLVWIDQHATAHPELALDWTYHPRQDEGNMTGGVAAISFNLRQGVTFHDGSEFNATVVKWNFDRIINISAFVDQNWYGRTWFNPSGLESRYTSTWNLSWADSDPFGTGGRIPFINSSIVVSEYVVNFTLNKWAMSVFDSAFTRGMGGIISMHSYKPWQNKVIYGFGEDPEFPQDNPAIFPGHLIGTGPFIFEYQDKLITQLSKATKNLNYWNRTALDAVGLGTIDDFFWRYFATRDARTNALLNGESDGAPHMLQQQLTDLPAIKADPLLDYYPTIFDPSIDCIQWLAAEGLNTPVIGVPNKIGPLSGVNYTTLEGMSPREMYPFIAEDYGYPAGTELPGGFNRSVRLAMSYAFNYDSYINVSYAGGDGIRTTSPFGMGSLYYDASVPHPDFDLDKARQILLDDPYYAGLLADRGLSLANDSATWQYAGQTNPMQIFSLISRPESAKPPFFEEALNNLGFAMTLRLVPEIYVDWMANGKAVNFDAFIYIWLNSATDPFGFFGSGMNLLYKSTSRRIPFNLFNFHHIANDTIDDWMREFPFAGTGQQALANKLSQQFLNYHMPFLYLGQYQFGNAINSGWKMTQLTIEYAGPAGVQPRFGWIGGARETLAPPAPPEIPGYSVILTLLAFSISSLAIVYLTLRKRRNL